jgi:2'-5' RNA ligase
MDEHQLDVMVALRPITTDWAHVALPHLTLAYAGKKSDLAPNDFNQLAKTVSSIAADFKTVQLETKGLEVFGQEPERLDVITLHPNANLLAMQRRVSFWDKSTFPFNPHCTIGPVGSNKGRPLPIALAFDRIMLSWGEEELNFNLKW